MAVGSDKIWRWSPAPAVVKYRVSLSLFKNQLIRKQNSYETKRERRYREKRNLALLWEI